MTRAKVLLDADPGVDDALAMLFLHRHPDVELVGLTTVLGNAHVDLTTRNALYLANAFDMNVPIAKGASTPLSGVPTKHWPTMVHGENGLGNHPVGSPSEELLDHRPAAEFIIDTLRAHPNEVTIVAVGRMTNLALALEQAPEIAGLAKAVVIMGGAFNVAGNVSPAAEANIWGDPEAADRVLGASWPVTVVGLDVTRQVVMTRAALAELGRVGGAAAALLEPISEGYIRFYEHQVADGMVIHDCCAAAYVTNPELFEVRSGSIRVVTEGIATGMTIQKPTAIPFPPGAWDEASAQAVCISVKSNAVLDLIRNVIAVKP